MIKSKIAGLMIVSVLLLTSVSLQSQSDTTPKPYPEPPSSLSLQLQSLTTLEPPSLADHLNWAQIRDPIDGHWLPNLTGLPDPDEVAALTENVYKILKTEQDKNCNAIDFNLKMMIFQHFVIYQQLINAENIYFNEETANQWAHVLGMILKESSGDTNNITSMSGKSISTYSSKSDLKHWRKILTLSKQSQIEMNYQTNFGLTQLSADRLFLAFRLVKDQSLKTAFLKGSKDGVWLSKKLSKAELAVRRLIWFYQDFAQGRLQESDQRIHRRDIKNPQYSARYHEGLKRALLYCGSAFMFGDSKKQGNASKMSMLEDAMASIAYCKLGNARGGYGKNKVNETCFAQWVTLCPALNIDIATLLPLSYFETRDEPPVCTSAFRRLIIKKP